VGCGEAGQQRAALVTGGGSGIGAAIASAFAEAGIRVAVTGRHRASLDASVARIREASGEAIAIVADVRSVEDMEVAVRRAAAEFGQLDIGVANAGIQPEACPLSEHSVDSWDEVLGTNLTGAWITAKTVVPELIRSGGGSFIAIGSGMARGRIPGSGAYAVAKAGVHALVRTLAVELRPHRVAVNEVIPGPTRTSGTRGDSTAVDGSFESRWEAEGEWVKEPAEVARLVLFVAGLPPYGTTGQVFSLAGRLL
jgi:NAD(P)-dependent dehydrogenase (short-subunit alcohol dehydrogenase family)